MFPSFLYYFSFSSPSTAASVVLGRSANGWTEWKDQYGKTLDEIIRKGNTFSLGDQSLVTSEDSWLILYLKFHISNGNNSFIISGYN